MHLRIRNLSRTHADGRSSLRGLSLSIPAGVFHLVGGRGTGKSTLGRILAGLEAADGGSARLDDVDLLDRGDDPRRVVGYLPADVYLRPAASIEALLDHHALRSGIADPGHRLSSVDDLLRQTNLWEARGHDPGAVPPGIRRRIGLALALLGNPRLLVLDDPARGLDRAGRIALLDVIRRLGNGRVVLLLTSDADDAVRTGAGVATLTDLPARAGNGTDRPGHVRQA
jgi:ABC-2 type transport system ATP-binding protein